MMKGLYTISLGEEVKELSRQKSLIHLALSQFSEKYMYANLFEILDHPIVIMSRKGYLLFNTTDRDESFWRMKMKGSTTTKWSGFQETRCYQVSLQHSEEMVHTLELFLEHDGQINEFAKKLYVHRNTVAYRMEKINSLLDIQFRNYNDIVKLKMIFWHYQKNKNKCKFK